MVKRLFIFAAYDKDSIIDDTLLYYLNSLSRLGDIIFIMDNNVPKSEIDKLSSITNILYANAVRHNEYDFGSYKRGYLYAYDNKLLNKYDWVYFVNDSVYGPLFDLNPVLIKAESAKTDLIGLVDYADKYTPKHIQSWFVGMSKKIVSLPLIHDFMVNIKHRDKKTEIICKYEVGLSRVILQNGFSMSSVFVQNEKDKHFVYEEPKKIIENFIPFIKKSALENLGGNVYLLPYTSDEFNNMIYNHAKRVGIKYPQEDVCAYIYRKCYRLTFLSLPIITIYKRQSDSNGKNYKIYLFDKIPIMKIEKRKVI